MVSNNESTDLGLNHENTQDVEQTNDGVATAPENSQPQQPESPCTLHKPAPAASELSAHFQDLFHAVNQLQESFDNKLAYDATKQQQIDKLHHELVEHRQDMVAKTKRPLVLSILRVYDDLGRLIDKYSNEGQLAGLTPERALKLICGIQEDIEILLDQNGILSFTSPSDTFEPKRQSVVEKVPTSDISQVGVIAKRVRLGFEQGNELLKKERVNVYVKSETPKSSSESAGSELMEASNEQ